MQNSKVGRWAFLVGIVIAILLGFVSFAYSSLVLFILGLIVGFINITEKEVTSYLIAVIALLVVGISGLQVLDVFGTIVNNWIQTVLTSFVIFVAASGLVVAVKSVLQMSKSE